MTQCIQSHSPFNGLKDRLLFPLKSLLMVILTMIFHGHLRADCTLSASVSISTYFTSGAGNGCSGTLTIQPGGQLIVNSSFTVPSAINTIIIQNGGQIYWGGNHTLTISPGTNIVILNTTTPYANHNNPATALATGAALGGDNCNNNRRLHIGSINYAACTGGGNVCILFNTLIANGGTLNIDAEVQLDVNAMGNTVCSGAFSLSAVISGNGIFINPPTYAWMQTSGPGTSTFSPSANVSSPSVSTTLPGTYMYRVTVTQNLSTSNCNTNESVSVTSDITVNIRPAPTGSISGTTTVCQGAGAPNITISNGVSDPVTIFYNINNGGAQSVMISGNGMMSIPVSTATPGIFTYDLDSIRYQSAPFCKTNITGLAAVTVASPPVPGGPFTSSTCIDQSVNINGNPQAGSGVYPNHLWTVINAGTTGATNANLSNATSQTVIFNATGLMTGMATLLYTVTDHNGCSGTKTVDVEVIIGAPGTPGPIMGSTAVCPNTSGLVYSINAVPNATSYAWTVPSGWSIDNGQSSTSITVTSGGCAGSGTIDVTAISSCAASNPTALAVSSVDNTPPTISGTLSDITVEGCSISDAPAAATTVSELETMGVLISDACTDDIGLIVSFMDAAPTSDCPVIFIRTYRVTDACLNTSVDIAQTIMVEDLTPPVFSAPDDITLVADMLCQYDASPEITGDVLDATDNCTMDLNPTFMDVTTSGACVGEILISRTWSLADNCNNAATDQIQIIRIVDNLPPSASNPNPLVLNCPSDIPEPNLEVVLDEADNCSSATVTWIQDISNEGEGCVDDPLIITRTFRVSDDCDNFIDVTQTITVVDTEDPTATNPAPSQYGCLTDVPMPDPDVVTDEADNCDDAPAVSFFGQTDNGGEGCMDDPLVITRTYWVEDDCGHTATVEHVITVVDNIPPTFTDPADITINKDGVCGYDADPSLTGDVNDEEDNCSTGLDATYTDVTASGACTGEIIITRTWTLTDDCGNSSQLEQIITTIDVTPPTVTAPDDVTLSCSLDLSDTATDIMMYLALPGAAALDNCSPNSELTVTSETNPIEEGDCAGLYERVYTITDDCGNAASAVQMISVQDDIDPVVETGDIEPCYETVEEAEIAVLSATTFSDNCTSEGDLNVEVTMTDGPECDSILTVTVYDGCGNSASADYQVQIGCQVVRLHVFLEGSYHLSGDTLRSDLNAANTLPGQINASPFIFDAPAGHPYNQAPWNYNMVTGTTFGDGMGQSPYPPSVVDWVLVSVRIGGKAPANTVWTCAGWVHTDGSVTFPENCPGPSFLQTDSVYVLVQHQNHLGVLSHASAEKICEGSAVYYDFRIRDSFRATFRVGQKEIEPGVWAMLASNGDQLVSIAAINSPDRTLWKSVQGFLGYNRGDFDMNISTNSTDETLWKLNQNRTTGVVFY